MNDGIQMFKEHLCHYLFVVQRQVGSISYMVPWQIHTIRCRSLAAFYSFHNSKQLWVVFTLNEEHHVFRNILFLDYSDLYYLFKGFWFIRWWLWKTGILDSSSSHVTCFVFFSSLISSRVSWSIQHLKGAEQKIKQKTKPPNIFNKPKVLVYLCRMRWLVTLCINTATFHMFCQNP